LSGIFRKRENKHFKACSDLLLNHFLNGYIIYKRGPKEADGTNTEKKGSTRDPSQITNNGDD